MEVKKSVLTMSMREAWLGVRKGEISFYSLCLLGERREWAAEGDLAGQPIVELSPADSCQSR